MESTELFYPEISVKIGDYSFAEGVSIEMSSAKTSYFDWAKMRFTREFQDAITINQKDAASIELGYDDDLTEVFTGFVTKPYNVASTADEILLRDKMMLLEETYITNTFLAATPQEILSYCLGVAGITDMQLSQTVYLPKAVVPIVRMDVISIIEELHSLWGISPKFFFSGGVFYWGTKPAQTKIYQFEYGENIISLKRSGGFWELMTVSVPFIRHSQIITVDHPQVSGDFEVQAVKFVTSDTGFIRTHIYF